MSSISDKDNIQYHQNKDDEQKDEDFCLGFLDPICKFWTQSLIGCVEDNFDVLVEKFSEFKEYLLWIWRFFNIGKSIYHIVETLRNPIS